MKHLLIAIVMFYRKCISPLKPPTCRFRPTCSAYAIEALRVHGTLRGSWLTLRRLLRCQPLCEPGEDPVPRANGPGTRPANHSDANAV